MSADSYFWKGNVFRCSPFATEGGIQKGNGILKNARASESAVIPSKNAPEPLPADYFLPVFTG